MQAKHGERGFGARTTEVDAVVAGIRTRFIARMSDACLDIEDMMIQMDKTGPDPRMLDEIASHAHKTAGLAPTLGFHALGKIALGIEGKLSSRIDPPAWTVLRPMVEEFLCAIEDVLDLPA